MVVKSLELLRIINWLNEMEIENYSINDDLSVDVDGSVWLNNKGLNEIPVQFNKVINTFDCSHNQLTSLEGAPREVGGWFSCQNNQLTSLEGAPREVGMWFGCSNNKITSLKGCPREVGGSFYCKYNKVEFSKEDIRKVCRVGVEVNV